MNDLAQNLSVPRKAIETEINSGIAHVEKLMKSAEKALPKIQLKLANICAALELVQVAHRKMSDCEKGVQQILGNALKAMNDFVDQQKQNWNRTTEEL